MNRGQSQNPSDSGAGIIIMVSIGAGATFIAAREEFSHFRSTPFRSRVFSQPRDKSCAVFRSVSLTSVNPAEVAIFFRSSFLPVALRIRAYTDLLQDFGETQIFGKRLESVSIFSVPKSRQPFQ